MFGLKLNKYEWFYPLVVVGHGSETQLQVGENFNHLISISGLRVNVTLTLTQL